MAAVLQKGLPNNEWNSLALAELPLQRSMDESSYCKSYVIKYIRHLGIQDVARLYHYKHNLQKEVYYLFTIH